MKKDQQLLRMRLRVQEDGVISGFSYPFTLLLTKRLKELYAKKNIFNGKQWPERWDEVESLNTETAAVVGHLEEQLNLCSQSSYSISRVALTIDTAENFLSIFSVG